MEQPIKLNMAEFAQLANEKLAENEVFVAGLRQMDAAVLDAKVLSLNQIVTPLINCLDCGNCCRSLMINVTETEASTLANHLGQTRTQFDAEYIEKGSNGMMLVNAIPCHFLGSENACTVYEHRFNGCREFPALHLPHFGKRLFTTFMHYNRCPIIFHVIERLKVALNFE